MIIVLGDQSFGELKRIRVKRERRDLLLKQRKENNAILIVAEQTD